MKILVLMSSYNGAKYLTEQIDSILNQKFNGILNLVVRDDGSNDETIDILQEYERQGKLKLLLGNNIGYVGSFFTLLDYAREQFCDYDYFALSDQDDVWDLDKLAIAVNMLENEKLEDIPLLYGSTSRLTDSNLKVLGQTTGCYKIISFYNVAVQNILPGHTQVLNKAMLNVIPIKLDYTKIYAHDYFITGLASIYGKIVFDKMSHVFYRQHNGNQLGVDANFFRRLVQRWNRVKRGDGIKIANQIQYLTEICLNRFSKEELYEVKRFLDNRNNFYNRLKYVVCMKFYRQTFLQTFLMKVMYLIGGFGI